MCLLLLSSSNDFFASRLCACLGSRLCGRKKRKWNLYIFIYLKRRAALQVCEPSSPQLPYVFRDSPLPTHQPVPVKTPNSGLFDQPLAGVRWPSALRSITLSAQFNQALEDVMWPTALKTLKFGVRFNQPLDLVKWPAALESITFGHGFDKVTFSSTVFDPRVCMWWYVCRRTRRL